MRYYLKDHLGSIRVTVNESGSPVGYDDYYPFGKIMDGRSNNSGNSNDLYKFTGHELDQEAGLDLVHAGARNYDPELGRWLSVDPLADVYPAWSPYNYTLGNPINLIDPDGMAVEEIPGGVRYTGIDAQNFFRQLKSQYGTESGSCPDPPCVGRDSETGKLYHMNADGERTDFVYGYPGEGLPWWLEPGPGGGRLKKGASLLKRFMVYLKGGASLKQVKAILKPGGKTVGNILKRNDKITTVTRKEAEEIFDQLINLGAKRVSKPSFNGTWFEIPGVGGFGVRKATSSTSKKLGTTNAIQLKIDGINIEQIKF